MMVTFDVSDFDSIRRLVYLGVRKIRSIGWLSATPVIGSLLYLGPPYIAANFEQLDAGLGIEATDVYRRAEERIQEIARQAAAS
jgi:hypothetical protein